MKRMKSLFLLGIFVFTSLIAGAGQITLEWNASPDAALNYAYAIYALPGVHTSFPGPKHVGAIRFRFPYNVQQGTVTLPDGQWSLTATLVRVTGEESRDSNIVVTTVKTPKQLPGAGKTLKPLEK